MLRCGWRLVQILNTVVCSVYAIRYVDCSFVKQGPRAAPAQTL